MSSIEGFFYQLDETYDIFDILKKTNPPIIVAEKPLNTLPLKLLSGHDKLTIHERILYYGITATIIEVVYTSIRHRDWPRLKGYTQLWVIPLYGVGSQYAFEPLHDLCRDQPIFVRAGVYALMFFSLEFAAAAILDKTTGVVPWDYNIDDSDNTPVPIKRKYAYGFKGKGYICLFPHVFVWAALGLAGEQFRSYIDRIHR